MASAIRIAFPDLTPHQQKLKQRQVHRWRHASAAIEKAGADGKGRRMKIRAHGVGTVLPREAEEQIAMWIADLRREGVPVSLMMLTFKAQEMAIASGIEAEEFSASSSWKKRFLATFRLSLGRKTRIGQIAPSDAEKVCRDFRLKVLATIEHHKIVQIFNADQTAMNNEFLPSTTINETGSKTVWVRNSGAEKKRLTVMLLADSRGHKLTPFVILKQAPSKVPKTQAFNQQQQNGFGRGVWREVAPLIEKYGFRIYGNTKAWWNSGLSLEFLKFHFGSRDNVGESVLLIWDDFSAHWTAEVLAYAASINVVLIKVPPGYTSSCQPPDVA
ncbi:hypothetical protein BBJ28_00021979 [Nothophytophthora sp. Chile5]|nr:hypothetical protein BBJ28_00021979 [Nothophytophthora sp. Chile5]